jgi:hypothetical protein
MSIPAIKVSNDLAPTRVTTAARGSEGLSSEAQQAVRKLKARDQAVRQHEQAHVSAGGSLVISGPNYVFERGPDGINYAVGGEVRIDTSPGRTPEDTLDKARRIQAAALAPADPSAQDRAVAAIARQLEIQARAELARIRAEGQGTLGSPRDPVERRAAELARTYGGMARQPPTLIAAA